MYTLELEYIGEGYSGDYNKDVVLNDERLLRFTLLKEDGEQVDGCSYCTLIRADHMTEDDIKKAEKILLDLITSESNMKSKAQELSWINDIEIKLMFK